MQKQWLALALLVSAGGSFTHAQTAGTSAPEVTQFEPVDTTDLVKLATGDFSYSIPAMVIPGAPGGGYPLALSYHAGILYDQTASWVGLGWNLSPGHVNRTIRGLPDDWHRAEIEGEEVFKSVHSYSVGLGAAAWSAGVKFDNHGGFGGYVGYSLTGSKGTYGRIQLEFGQGDIGYSVKLGGPIGSSQFASYEVGFGSEAGLSAGTSLRSPLGFGTNLNSVSGLDVFKTGSGGGRLFSLGSNATGVRASAGGTSGGFSSNASQQGNLITKSTAYNLSIPLGSITLDLGYQRRSAKRQINSLGFGSIHLPNINDDTFAHFRDTEELDVLFGAGHLDLDFYTQDFDSKRTNFHYSIKNQSSFNFDWQTYEADFIQTEYDGYGFAAQGLSGNARPFLDNRGWIKPSEPIMSNFLGNDKYFHPYRSFYEKITDLSDNFTGNYRDLMIGYAEEGWNHADGVVTPLEGAMVFLDDPAFLENFQAYSRTELHQKGNYLAQRANLRNQSQRISYRLDGSSLLIAEIRVTRADGLIYIFGEHKDNGGRRYGAAPKINSEKIWSKIATEHGDNATSTMWNERKSPYPYAWYLAAVITPDYTDVTGDGYTPDDFGRYITFDYAQISGDYDWLVPWSSENGITNYILTGITGEAGDRFQFERREGRKEIWVPLRAETPTHVALFDFRPQETMRKDGLGARTIDGEIPYKVASPASGSGLNLDGVPVPITPSQDNFIVGIDRGIPLIRGLNINDSLNVKMGSTSQNLVTMTYRGVLAGTPWALFESPQSPTPDDLRLSNYRSRLARLNQISLHTREAYTKSLIEIMNHPTNSGLVSLDQLLETPNYLAQTRFNYSYDLAPNNPNSEGSEIGRLTLEGVDFYGKGNIKGNPGYRFDYYNETSFPWQGYARRDPWGYYSGISDDRFSAVDPSNFTDPETGALVPFQANWSLKSIVTPIGTRIGVEYEADRYSYVQDRLAVNFHFDDGNQSRLWFGVPTPNQRDYVQTWIESQTFNLAGRFDKTKVRVVGSSYSISNPWHISVEVPVQVVSSQGGGQSVYSIVPDNERFNRFLDGLYLGIEGEVPPLDPDRFEIRAINLGLEGGTVIYDSEAPFGNIDELVQTNTCQGFPLCSGTVDVPWAAFLNAPQTYADKPFILDPNQHATDQVVVSVRYTTDEGAVNPPIHHKYFVLPVAPVDNTGNYWFRQHPALNDFRKFLTYQHYWHGIFTAHLDGYQGTKHKALEIRVYPIPQSNNFPTMSHANGLVGTLGGGLRVKQLTMEPNLGEGDTYTQRYYYTDPASWEHVANKELGFESGAIFVDPPLAVSGVEGGDRRIIPAENYPYHNMSGSQVFYEYVSVELQAEGLNNGITTHRFHTPKHERISAPFGWDEELAKETITDANGTAVGDRGTRKHGVLSSQTVVHFPTANTHESYGPNELTYFERRPSGAIVDGPWDHQVHFKIERDVRQTVMNNHALLGQPMEVVIRDGTGQILNTRNYTYVGNHDDATQPLLKKFSLDGNGLAEENETGRRAQGVQVEKSQGLLLGIIDRNTNPSEYFGKIMMVDEIRNAFRNTMVTTQSYEYPPGETQPLISTTAEHHLAYDPYTAKTALAYTEMRDSRGNANRIYSLQIPAHQISQIGPAMRHGNQVLAGNMLTQEGFRLNAVQIETEGVHSPLDNLNFMDELAMGKATVTGASFDHWTLLDGRTPIVDAVFHYIHKSTAKQSTGWRHPYLDWPTETANLLDLKVTLPPTSGEGTWQASGQNTVYDHYRNVLEFRDRANHFSAARYILNGQLLAANFTNGQNSQVLYEGFEDPSTLAGGATAPSRFVLENFNDGLTAGDFASNIIQTYAGSHCWIGPWSKQQDFQGGALQTAYGNAASDSRDHYWVSFFVRDTQTVEIAGMNIDLSVPLGTGDQLIRQVDHGWFHLRLKLSSATINQLTINPGTHGRLDEITIYPAANGENPLESLAYRSDARVSHYGYHPHHRQLTSMTDERGRTARFQYDQRGQLLRVYDIEGRVRTEHYRSYHGWSLDGTTTE